MNNFALFLTLAVLVTGICRALAWYQGLTQRINSNVSTDVPGSRLRGNNLLKWVIPAGSLFPVLLVVLLIRCFACEPFRIPSASMMPTLLPGDFILADKFSYGLKNPFNQKTLIKTGHPNRGDIAVFRYPEDERQLFIKRAIGLPGDHILYDAHARTLAVHPADQNRGSNQASYIADQWPSRLRDETLSGRSHRIQLDAEKIADPARFYQQMGLPKGEWVVPEGQYFMMGDNRDNSLDSRYWGFVPERNLVGKAVAIWFSLLPGESGWPVGVRLNRIGSLG